MKLVFEHDGVDYQITPFDTTEGVGWINVTSSPLNSIHLVEQGERYYQDLLPHLYTFTVDPYRTTYNNYITNNYYAPEHLIECDNDVNEHPMIVISDISLYYDKEYEIKPKIEIGSGGQGGTVIE